MDVTVCHLGVKLVFKLRENNPFAPVKRGLHIFKNKNPGLISVFEPLASFLKNSRAWLPFCRDGFCYYPARITIEERRSTRKLSAIRQR